MTQAEDFLEHYGVKGMHWGFRKARGTRVSVEGKRTEAALHKVKSNKTGVRALTNHELQQVNKRIQLENNFKTLTAKKSNLDKIQKGQKHVKELWATGAGLTAAAVAFSQSKTGKKLIDKALGSGKHFAK